MITMNTARNRAYRLLRWSERYVKTDMVYLIKGSFWLSIGQVVAALSSFVLAVALANFLPQNVYGLYKYVLSAAGIVWAFSLTGLSAAIIRDVARGKEGALQQGFKTNLKWSIPIVVISFSGAAYYWWNNNTTLALAFLIIGLFSPILNSANLYGAFLNGKQQFKENTILWSLGTIITTATIIGTAFYTDSPAILILSYFLSNTITNALVYVYVIRIHKPNETTSKETISYGKHLSFINILGGIATQIDKILIFHFLGAVELAVYSFATAVPEQIKGLFKNVAKLAFPKFSQRSLADIQSGGLRKKMLYFGILTAIAAIFYIALAPLMYKIFFPQYLESIFYSQIFAISILAVTSNIPVTILQSQAIKSKLYKHSILVNSFQIITNLLFISLFGIMGAVIAGIINRFTNLIISYYLVTQKENTPSSAKASP